MKTKMKDKLQNLKNNIKTYDKVAVAYSGGVDSEFLLKAAHDVLGDKAVAVTIVSPLIPKRERDCTDEFCQRENIGHIKMEINPLMIDGFKENPVNRCYLCKKHMFTCLKAEMEKEGISSIFEGSNMDDTKVYRPGMRAIEELGIKSPLIEAGLTKNEIRALSKEMELPTWNKPSFACLASRFPYGEEISTERLNMIEKGEEYLRELEFSQYRVRLHGDIARIEVIREDFNKIIALSDSIVDYFKKLGFVYTTLDLSGFRSGSMDETVKNK